MNTRIYYSKDAERLAKQWQLLRGLSFISLGLAVGTAVALLFAPNKGEETRQLITDAVEQGYQRGREATEEALKQLENEYPDLRKKVSQIIEDIQQR